MGLSERERAILDFEGSWWTRGGPKQEAIRTTLGLSPTGYYRLLGALAERAEAEAYDPLLVRRLRRQRDLRRRARFEGRRADGRPPR